DRRAAALDELGAKTGDERAGRSAEDLLNAAADARGKSGPAGRDSLQPAAADGRAEITAEDDFLPAATNNRSTSHATGGDEQAPAGTYDRSDGNAAGYHCPGITIKKRVPGARRTGTNDEADAGHGAVRPSGSGACAV